MTTARNDNNCWGAPRDNGQADAFYSAGSKNSEATHPTSFVESETSTSYHKYSSASTGPLNISRTSPDGSSSTISAEVVPSARMFTPSVVTTKSPTAYSPVPVSSGTGVSSVSGSTDSSTTSCGVDEPVDPE